MRLAASAKGTLHITPASVWTPDATAGSSRSPATGTPRPLEILRGRPHRAGRHQHPPRADHQLESRRASARHAHDSQQPGSSDPFSALGGSLTPATQLLPRRARPLGLPGECELGVGQAEQPYLPVAERLQFCRAAADAIVLAEHDPAALPREPARWHRQSPGRFAHRRRRPACPDHQPSLEEGCRERYLAQAAVDQELRRRGGDRVTTPAGNDP